jgi:hypothetical protein
MTRRRSRSRVQGGFYHIESIHQRTLTGFGDGEFVRLRDEHGNIWRGHADVQDDHTVRYRFRDAEGHSISGVSDNYGIVLRDEKGATWRGYVY